MSAAPSCDEREGKNKQKHARRRTQTFILRTASRLPLFCSNRGPGRSSHNVVRRETLGLLLSQSLAVCVAQKAVCQCKPSLETKQDTQWQNSAQPPPKFVLPARKQRGPVYSTESCYFTPRSVRFRVLLGVTRTSWGRSASRGLLPVQQVAQKGGVCIYVSKMLRLMYQN